MEMNDGNHNSDFSDNSNFRTSFMNPIKFYISEVHEPYQGDGWEGNARYDVDMASVIDDHQLNYITSVVDIGTLDGTLELNLLNYNEYNFKDGYLSEWLSSFFLDDVKVNVYLDSSVYRLQCEVDAIQQLFDLRWRMVSRTVTKHVEWRRRNVKTID